MQEVAPAERLQENAPQQAYWTDAFGRKAAAFAEQHRGERFLLYLACNGGPTQANTWRNAPQSGTKGQVLEGAIRGRFIVEWKAQLPAGPTCR